MTVLIINYHLQDVIGGSEVQCDLLAKYFVRLGHNVVYFAVDGSSTSYETDYSVESGRLCWKDLRRVVTRYRPEVVLWRFSKRKFLLSALIFKLMKLKLVFSVCNIYDVTPWAHKISLQDVSAKKGKKKFRTLKAFLREVVASRINHFGYYLTDAVIAQTEEQTGRVPVTEEVLIYNSAESTSVSFSWERPFVIWVANLKKRKNPEAYIELARIFENSGIDFLMVGGIQNSRYTYLLDDATLPSNLHYLGKKQYAEVNGIIQRSLFLVHTTYGPEGFPNVFIQAWLQGKPAVSLFCDPDSIIQRQKLGYLSGSLPQLEKDVQRLLENESLRNEIGTRAKMFAAESFRPEQNAEKFVAFFQKITTHSA